MADDSTQGQVPGAQAAEPAREASAVPPKPKPKKKKAIPTEINFYSYPNLVFVWPLIVAGPLFAGLEKVVPAEVLGWLYAGVSLLVILALGIDIERNHVFMLALAGMAIAFAGMWLADAQNIPVFGEIFRWFADMDLQYDRTFGNILALFLAIAYLLMIIGTRFNNKWRITHNEIEQRAWGRREKAYPRIGKTFRTTYPDWLEALLCLSGSLVVSDSRGDRIVEQIDHIPLLPFKARRLDRILETWSVTVSNQEAVIQVADEEAEADDARYR